MPELPDLEVAKNFLAPRLRGQTIIEVELQSPVLLRRPTAEVFSTTLLNRSIREIARFGKFLIFSFSPPARLYLNFMLTGRLSLQSPAAPKRKKMGFRLQLANNQDLRYHDLKNMGKLYLLLNGESTSLIPNYDEQGPDALDPSLGQELFCQRIKKFQGLIKNILVNQRFIAGLGNAYADEILFVARIAPFRTRSQLTNKDIVELYRATKSVLNDAIAKISQRMGDTLDFEKRDFLQVHGKGGQACPRCGTRLSSVKSGLRVANFCRTCQK